MIDNMVSNVSFGVVCAGCGIQYVVTAEDVFNSADFCCDQCGNLIDLVEVCGAALAQFTEDNLEEIWDVAQRVKRDELPAHEKTCFDNFL